jgi:hypothetical protein
VLADHRLEIIDRLMRADQQQTMEALDCEEWAVPRELRELVDGAGG